MFQFECRLLYHCFQQELKVMNFLVWKRPCWQQKLDYLLACRYSSWHLRDVFLPVRHSGCRDDAKLRLCLTSDRCCWPGCTKPVLALRDARAGMPCLVKNRSELWTIDLHGSWRSNQWEFCCPLWLTIGLLHDSKSNLSQMLSESVLEGTSLCYIKMRDWCLGCSK